MPTPLATTLLGCGALLIALSPVAAAAVGIAAVVLEVFLSGQA